MDPCVRRSVPGVLFHIVFQVHVQKSASVDQDEDSCICHDAQSQRFEIVPEVWIGIHQNYWMWQHIHQSHFVNILSV